MGRFLKNYNTLGKVLIIVFILLSFALAYIGVTYAYWSSTHVQEEANSVKSGCLNLKFTELTDSIELKNTYPMTENEAMKKTPYTFEIENTCTIDMYYNITLNTTGNADLDDYMYYKLIEGTSEVTGPTIISTLQTYSDYVGQVFKKTPEDTGYNIFNSYILKSGRLSHATMDENNTTIITAGEKKKYKLYLWIDETVEGVSTMDKSFEGKIIVSSGSSQLDS